MLQSLPFELLIHVGSFCDSPQLHSLALVNHSFYDIFNPCLYRHNVLYDHPAAASVLWAAEAGSLSTLKIAIAHGADINTTGASSEYMVWQTAKDEPLSEELYATPLHLAVDTGHEDIVRWLLENGARVNIPAFGLCDCNLPHDPSEIPREVWYPVHYAILHNYSDSMLHLLLQHRAVWSTKVYPVIADAIADSNISAINIIMQNDAFDPEYRDLSGYTAMHFVSFCEDLDTVGEITQRLIDRGVPLDAVSNHGTALNMMVRDHKFKHAIALLECGADPTADPEEEDGAGLGIIDRIFDQENEDDIEFNLLAKRSHTTEEQRQDRRRLLELVIAGGADVNRVLGRGNPPLTRPLYWALLESKDVECVRILLDAGARIEDAFVHNDSESEGLLRAFFNAETSYMSISLDGDTEEAFEPYKESLKLFLERGARIDAPENVGLSALDKVCDLDYYDRGIWKLKFLVEYATSRNVRVEFVEDFMEEFREDDLEVYTLLEQLHEKLINEKNG
jgi:ankyrin repeat protein